jgi:Flp pilus assembly pilin Flp
MITFWKRFSRDEDGAVTVDWVVLTALVAGLSIGFINEMRNDANNLSNLTQNYLEAQEPGEIAGNIQD